MTSSANGATSTATAEVRSTGRGGRKHCDLIMKGGITSGVVYPEAVLELHKDFDFKCIGGASAGAIAAAATAAAQFGELAQGTAAAQAPNTRGFDGLRALNEELRQPGKLIELFQPTAAAQPLLEVFLSGLRGAHRAKGWKSVCWSFAYTLGACIARLPIALLVGGLVGFGVYSALVRLVDGSFGSAPVLAALFVIAGALLGALVQLCWILWRVLPEQGFGICRLHVPETNDPSATPPLTDWLFRRFDEIAGVQGPVTFGDLEAKEIELKLITTNLSELRPYVLPFEDHRFLFNLEEFREYFPKYAVDQMEREQHPSTSVVPPPGFCFLPSAGKLPIAFGARLSLSFPVLISAVPLYSIRAQAFSAREKGKPLQLNAGDLKKNWFSDGGICSNFPIHFFDHWLPTRPTFGISLGSMPSDQVSTVRKPLDGIAGATEVEPRRSEPVHLPQANRPEAAAWHEVSTVAQLFTSMFDTMMAYRDTMQSELPGFRERIVEIRLTNDEGGLNLDMDPTRIQRLADKGAKAGELLRAFNFDEHRWVRLQVLMPPLAEELEHLLLQTTTFGGWPQANHPYHRGASWLNAMQTCLTALAATTADNALGPLKLSDPKPPATLRASPRI